MFAGRKSLGGGGACTPAQCYVPEWYMLLFIYNCMNPVTLSVSKPIVASFIDPSIIDCPS